MVLLANHRYRCYLWVTISVFIPISPWHLAYMPEPDFGYLLVVCSYVHEES